MNCKLFDRNFIQKFSGKATFNENRLVNSNNEGKIFFSFELFSWHTISELLKNLTNRTIYSVTKTNGWRMFVLWECTDVKTLCVRNLDTQLSNKNINFKVEFISQLILLLSIERTKEIRCFNIIVIILFMWGINYLFLV